MTLRSMLAILQTRPTHSRAAELRTALAAKGVSVDDLEILVPLGVALASFYFWPSGAPIAAADDAGNVVIDLPSFLDTAAPVPAPPPVEPPPVQLSPLTPAPPLASGGADQIDLSEYAITENSPADIASWPITVSLEMSSLEPAITPAFALPDRWADVIPPGFEGPIAFTVWAFIPARKVGAGFIEMWRGRPNCGNNDAGNARAQLYQNWWYRAAGMSGYLPSPGEQIAFMVCAGDARDGKGPYPVRERSNVVLVTMP